MANLTCTFTASQSGLGPDVVSISELNKTFSVEAPAVTNGSQGIAAGGAAQEILFTTPTKDTYVFIKNTSAAGGDVTLWVGASTCQWGSLLAGDWCFARLAGATEFRATNESASVAATLEFCYFEAVTDVAP